MPIPLYLAITAPELSSAAVLPDALAYMACHFSLYNAGLSNLPKSLPENSMLILNDSIPPNGNDPAVICKQLSELSEAIPYQCILLDFQRPGNALTQEIASAILSSVPCPVIVSDLYAKDLDCPVFISAIACNHALKAHIQKWQGREIWLEVSRDSRIITVDASGCRQIPCSPGDPALLPHWEQRLHCHYRIEPEQSKVRFILQRTIEDLNTLLQEAEQLGIVGAVGLYQELCGA